LQNSIEESYFANPISISFYIGGSLEYYVSSSLTYRTSTTSVNKEINPTPIHLTTGTYAATANDRNKNATSGKPLRRTVNPL
jgi:hypothetical protein